MSTNIVHDLPGDKKGKADAAPKTAKHALLRVFCSGHEPTEIHPGVMGPGDWDDLVEQARQCAGSAVLEIVNLHRWPDDARSALLASVRDLDGKARLRVGGKTYADPFEAILAGLVGKPLAAHQKTLRAAKEAAAVFYGNAPDAAAKQINDRLAALGLPRTNHPGLVKELRGLAAADNGAETSGDAGALAGQFVRALRAEPNIEDDHPVLRYYQADFYLWNGRCWAKREDKQFAARVMAFLQSSECRKVTERLCNDVIAHLGGLTLLDCWSEPMPFMVANEAPLQITRPSFVVFRNGILDLGGCIKGKGPPALLDHDSRYFNEVVLPYDYDPKAKCPLWLATLKDIFPKTGKDDRRQLVLQEFMGYTLLPDCRFNKMMILYGEGGNGRSTITETWEALLGDGNVSDVALESLGAEYRLWSLKGKLANFSGELQYLGKMHEGLVKRIVSGEQLDANRKFKAPAKFRPFAKLVVNTNDMPQIHDTSDGTWDRLITMPFEVRIRGTKKEDKGRVAKLQEELPGIFNWALTGLKRLLKQGHFTKCAKCEAFLDSHRTDSDTVRLFASECLAEGSGWRTFSVPLYAFYQFYCAATGRKPVAESEFGRRMKRLGWQKEREKTGARRLYYSEMKLSATGRTYREVGLERKACSGPIACKGSTSMA